MQCSSVTMVDEGITQQIFRRDGDAAGMAMSMIFRRDGDAAGRAMNLQTQR